MKTTVSEFHGLVAFAAIVFTTTACAVESEGRVYEYEHLEDAEELVFLQDFSRWQGAYGSATSIWAET